VKAPKPPKEKKEKKAEKVKEKVKEKKATANNAAKLTNTNKKQNKASLEALELETEQTLKDINKWLEHTPK
jgi:flavodoxin